ncbi:MAG: hypothetical protein ABWY45_00695 [Mycobacterium sp.]
MSEWTEDEPASDHLADEITATYHAKYDQCGPGSVGAVTGNDVLETTLRVLPEGLGTD